MKSEALTLKNEDQYRQLTIDYERFLENYETAILSNHDLFFTKRTLCKLLLPVISNHPTLTRSLIEQQVVLQQAQKEQFLECLSELVVEMDRDKKQLGEDCFTLDEVVQLVLMKYRKTPDPAFSEDFILYCSKKLISEVKKQFLLKNELSVAQLDQFPADQEIPLTLLHTCF